VKGLFLILLISTSAAAVETCGEAPAKGSQFEMGLALESLIPSRLPGFDATVPAYGVVVSIPWGKDSLELEVLYGSSPGVGVKLFEAGYRLNVETPHLGGYALAGAHFLSYTTPGPDENFIGGFLGMGATVSMAERFGIDAFLKTYFMTRPMVAVGGAFRLAL
jgi:hypothetical protein